MHTLYVWRSKFDGLEPDDIEQTKELEEENRRLKMLVADLFECIKRAAIGIH